MNKLKYLIFFFIFPLYLSAQQTYVYSYVDPCTGVIKSLNVPSNGVTVTYFGQINTFQPQDFNNGVFNQWASGVFNGFGNNNPCGSILGVSTSIDIAQTSALNTFNIISSISALSDLQQSMSSMSAMNTNGVTESTKSESKGSKNKKNGSQGGTTGSGTTGTTGTQGGTTGSQGGTTGSQGGTTGTTGTQGGTTGSGTTGTTGSQGGTTGSGTTGTTGSQGGTTGSQGGTTGSGTTGTTGSQGGTTGSGTQSEGGNSGTQTPNETEEGKSNILGGTINSVQNSSENGGRGNAPMIILSSDFAGFNFVDNETSFGGKGTGGFTSLRWDGKRTHGVLLDYTSVVGGPNITGFYGFIGKRKIDLISISGTASFIGRGSLYATAAVGQMWSFKSVKKLKLIYMGTASLGHVYGESFIGTAAIAGGMYDWKIGKRIDIKLTGLYIYAPYVSYYNDIVLNSPHVILPLIGTNIGITKKFKLNINVGGTYALNQNVMNYTVMFGTRFAL